MPKPLPRKSYNPRQDYFRLRRWASTSNPVASEPEAPTAPATSEPEAPAAVSNPVASEPEALAASAPGFSLTGYPVESFVSYQTNRQLSGWSSPAGQILSSASEQTTATPPAPEQTTERTTEPATPEPEASTAPATLEPEASAVSAPAPTPEETTEPVRHTHSEQEREADEAPNLKYEIIEAVLDRANANWPTLRPADWVHLVQMNARRWERECAKRGVDFPTPGRTAIENAARNAIARRSR